MEPFGSPFTGSVYLWKVSLAARLTFESYNSPLKVRVTFYDFVANFFGPRMVLGPSYKPTEKDFTMEHLGSSFTGSVSLSIYGKLA